MRARVPKQLLANGPFTRDDAMRAGLQRWHLETGAWKRIGPRTFIAAPTDETPQVKLSAANHRMPDGGAFSGLTAVFLHGLDDVFREPIEITVPSQSPVSTRVGMVVRRRALDPAEVVHVDRFRVTSVLRTLHDVARLLTLVDVVVMADRALHLRLVAREQLRTSRRLERIDGLVEPRSESPMETRLRMLLVQAGLPRPQAQVPIRNRFYRVIARPDLYYPEQRLGLEYDGGTHKESLAEDNRRQNLLTGAGVRLLRFTAGDLHNTPDVVIAQVRAALAERP